ncbi:MAG TPA: type III-B CRISPR-associated protein Cas10/Cmr2 [Polyangium sp.]|nr:type III-B CRISPR-associated protein Cas10/Cmr2 [Polyangium sp.]
MPHVLIISLGPIQDFIAAARRCRDLWYGSWLLSDASKAVARGVEQAVGINNLVFPGASPKELAPNSDTSVANKIVAIVPDAQKPSDVAEAACKVMKDRLNDLAADIFNEVEHNEKKYHWRPFFRRETAQAQINDLLEFLWVSAPFDEKTSYAHARKAAEELLAQRKRTMLWSVVPWKPEPGIPKSSLDGERESVIDEAAFDSKKNHAYRENELRLIYGLATNERLCGIGILKRLGEREGYKDHRFLSTPHLASMPLLQRMKAKRHDIAPAWKQYLKELNSIGADLEQTSARWDILLDHYDGQLLFETRLEEWFDHLPKDQQRSALKRAQRALDDFFTKTKLPRPSPYFAVLMADGDHMGKAISHRDSVEAHQKLSLALDEFAQNAKTIVEDWGHGHGGELIYSGGDDVLAFVPLNLAIECAQALQRDFAKRLEDFPHAKGSPTLSVGIAIGHFMDPMGDAFKLARQAEKKAKVERNSLAIIVDKRSGPPTVVTGIWGSVDKHILQFAEWHRNEDIPDGVAFELQELGGLLAHAEKDQRATIQALIHKETERILGRKRAQRGEKPIDDQILGELLDVPHELAERLIVARLIAHAKNIAEGDLLKPKKEGT